MTAAEEATLLAGARDGEAAGTAAKRAEEPLPEEATSPSSNLRLSPEGAIRAVVEWSPFPVSNAQRSVGKGRKGAGL